MLSNRIPITLAKLQKKNLMSSAMRFQSNDSNNNTTNKSVANTSEGSKKGGNNEQSAVQTRRQGAYDPLNVFYDMEKEFDRLFSNSMFRPMWPSFFGNRFNFDWPSPDTVSTQKVKSLAIDFKETPDKYEIHAELPGAKKEDIKIHLDESQGLLTITGETKFEKDEKNDKYHTMERRYGSFSRSIRVPDNVKMEDISANYENGVLLVKIPKENRDEHMKKPKEIKIE